MVMPASPPPPVGQPSSYRPLQLSSTWAAANATASSPILVVDQHTGFVSTTDTVDGVHPNAAGSVKIATKWYAALTPLF